jgi:putative oxidoreductase
MVFESIVGVGLDTASLLMRVALGAIFVIHGYPKLKSGGKDAGQWLKGMGIPPGFGLFAGVVEFFGGIALITGLFTSVVAGLFTLWMLALIWLSVVKVHKKFVGGYEFDVLLLLFSLALAIVGVGAFSLDHLLRFVV